MINAIEMYATNSESLNAKLELEISNAVALMRRNGSISVEDAMNGTSFRMLICEASLMALREGETVEPGDLQDAKRNVAEYIVECAIETNK